MSSVHALPEGFQLADHPQLGRVIAINLKPSNEPVQLLFPFKDLLYGFMHGWRFPAELVDELENDVHALPRGFRLAEHPQLGRVVIAPDPDIDGSLCVIYPDENSYLGYGRNWCFPDDLEFLD